MEELNIITSINVFEYIIVEQYWRVKYTGSNLDIPTVCVITVEWNDNGNLISSNTQIVLICNLEQRFKDSSKVYAPILYQNQLHLLTSISILKYYILDQFDWKN